MQAGNDSTVQRPGGLVARIESTIAEHGLLRRGEKLLVAVSGGLDSMVLLHVLHSLAKRHQWRLAVAHLNHQLRGRAANADQRLVEHTSVELGIRCVAEAADIRAFAIREKVSIEMAARELRHAFLARWAKKLGCKTIALAHHGDDQVELFLLRVMRGAAARGLGGMAWTSPSPTDAAIRLIRPLLGETKAALADFAAEQRIAFRDDASNQCEDILRNRIRNSLLPLLRKEYQPGIDAVLRREAEVLRQQADFIHAEAEQLLNERMVAFAQLPLALQTEVIRLQLLRFGVQPDYDLVKRLCAVPGKTVSASRDLVCMQEDGQVRVHKLPRPAAFFDDSNIVDISSPRGSGSFARVSYSWRVAKSSRIPAHRESGESFDAGHVGRTIVLRHWRPGDRFRPIGMRWAVKLQDLFVNAKIPALDRRRALVATTEQDEIFWVEGLRIGERFKITAKTAVRLDWFWKRGKEISRKEGSKYDPGRAEFRYAEAKSESRGPSPRSPEQKAKR